MTTIDCPKGIETIIENVRVYITYRGPEQVGHVEQDERWAVILPELQQQEADDISDGKAVWWSYASDQLVPVFRAGDNTNPPADDPDYAWVHDTWALNADGHWTRKDGLS